MTPSQSARTVVVAAFIEVFFVLARARQTGEGTEKTIKSLWAIGAITLGLSIVSDFIPQIAGPFAILVLVALAARSRGELGQVLGVGTSPAAASPGSAAAGGPSPQQQPAGREAPGFSPGSPSQTGREAPGFSPGR